MQINIVCDLGSVVKNILLHPCVFILDNIEACFDYSALLMYKTMEGKFNMKKMLSLAVAGGVLAASASIASSADFRVSGTFDFGFGLYDNTSFTKDDGEENFDAKQRFRAQIEVITSESLKGVAQFEIGDTEWGSGGGATWGGSNVGGSSGGAMGSDGVAVEVRHLYLDWLVPQTDLQVRMGIQPFALPRAVGRADGEDGGYILDDDMAGVLFSYNFNENAGINLGWFRPWDGAVGSGPHTDPAGFRWGSHDEVDIFALAFPIEMKSNFNFTPYFMFATIGDRMSGGAEQNGDPKTGFDGGTVARWLTGNGAFGKDGTAWWTGFAFDMSYLDPFVASVDFTYGSYSADDVTTPDPGMPAPYPGTPASPDRAGWAVMAKFGYKLDYFTPILFGWYGSGADVDGGDGLDGLLPSLSPDWGLTSFGWSNAHFGGREYLIGDSPAGTWAIGVGLEDIRFIDNLTSQLRFAYFRGTNDVEHFNMTQGNAFRDYKLLDSSDWGMEVNLDNVINIYENLDMFVELAWIHLSLDHEPADFDDNAWKGYLGFTYAF
ncbi:MAG: outer membrane homotrimeric porin [Desulfovibrionaceae bacterium]|nr:outer membrane homotrimeric porin [Desulfovibrionaceae bacterium]